MTRTFKNILVSSLIMLSDYIAYQLPLLAITNDRSVEGINQSITNWINLHLILGCVCVIWFGARLRHYFYRKTFWFELKETLRTIIIFWVFELAIISFTQWIIPQKTLMLTWLMIFILLPAMRVLVKLFLSKIGCWEKDTIIIGDGINALDAYKAISYEKNLGFRVVKFIGDESSKNRKDNIFGVPVEYHNELDEGLFNKRTQFIIAVEDSQSELVNKWLQEFMLKGYRYVSVIPTLRGMPLDSTDMSFIFSHELMILRVHQNLAKLPARIAKRIFDIIVSTTIILTISPLLLFIMLKVRKDGGPAIYGHERIGSNGKKFKCLKFRSMAVNSKELLNKLLETDPEARKEWEETFKLKNDPRVTKIGDFLRRTSLDELPQLFNVLIGEMSLVGPRPIIDEELPRYHNQVGYYLLSKPGMTGLWQVSGRSDVDYETRVYFDSWYVKNWSMWNDIVILFKTIGVVLNRDGAY